MIELNEYSNLKTISESSRTLVYRAFSKELQKSVILKIMAQEHPSPKEVFRFKNEFETLKQFDFDGVPVVHSFKKEGHRYFIVTDDSNGYPLSEILLARPMSLIEFLKISISLLKTLQRIHRKNIIHRDLKPKNIVYNPETEEVKIIDFGLAVPLSSQAKAPLGVLEGTLEYMPPEQTGRINRIVDFRSDIYSLGMSFYQMISSQMPYSTKDPTALVHCQIAKLPKPLSLVDPAIPQTISKVIERMIQKASDDRYQTAKGVLLDFERCLVELEEKGSISEFEIGLHDKVERLIIPQKLYGREKEIKNLREQFEKSVKGNKNIAFITGKPGIGKSALIGELFDLFVEKESYFIRGKFDQFRKDIPLSAISEAFCSLIHQILKEDDEVVEVWKEKLSKALKGNASLLVKMIPKLELLIEPQEESGEYLSSESENRFQMAISEFIKLFSERGRPLVIFIDDMQWMDSSSYRILLNLLSDKSVNNLFLIGAYRDNEVDFSDPLTFLIEGLKENHVVYNNYALNELYLTHVKEMVLDIFKIEASSSDNLANLLYDKTAGNPYFINQFLKCVYENEYLNYSTENGWQWDIDKIRALNVTNNVVDLLHDKMHALDKDSKEILNVAACLGSTFKFKDLLAFYGNNEHDLYVILQKIVLNGFITPIEEGLYRFAHDKVHEAAYIMIPDRVRKQTHYQIGNRILKKLSDSEVNQEIFSIAEHLNLGIDCLQGDEEKLRLAEINLEAANKAFESTVFEASIEYVNQGVKCLEALEVLDNYEIEVDLKYIKAYSLYSIGKYEESEKLVRGLLGRAKTKLSKGKTYYLTMILCQATSQFDRGVDVGIEALKCFGFSLTKRPNFLFVLIYSFVTLGRLKNVGYENIQNIQKNDSEEYLLLNEILIALGASAYFVNKNLFLYSVLRAINIVLKKGMAPASINFFSYFITFLGSKLGKFEDADKIAEAVLRTNKNIVVDRNYGFSLFTYGAFYKHWNSPVQKSLEVLEKCFLSLRDLGDIVVANFTALYITNYSLYSGKTLDECKRITNAYLNYLSKVKDENTYDSALTVLMFTQCLKGDTSFLGRFESEDELEEDFISRIESHRTPNAKGWYGLHKMWAMYVLGNFDEALAAQKFAKVTLSASESSYAVVLYHFYSALLFVSLFENADILAKRKYKKDIEKSLKFLSKWSDINPSMNLSLYLTLKVEFEKVCLGQEVKISIYDEILQVTQKYQQIHIEALVNELAARHFYSEKLVSAGSVYINRARLCYEIWGAHYKVKLLSFEYPDMQNTKTKAGSLTSISQTASEESGFSNLLDVQTILKSTNALISEIQIDKLLEKLIALLIESAGAERGLLLTPEEDKMYVMADKSIATNDKNKAVHKLLEEYKDLPASIINYVKKTHENVVIDDTSDENKFADDPYFEGHLTKSILCYPLMSSGQLKGVIYLENNKTAGVFTKDRLELLKILSSQAAFSLENARLYEDMEEQLRMETELKTAKTVQETLFPVNNANIGGVEIHGHYEPATECGGDWWYYNKIGDKIYFWVGDATGHGAAAALITSAARSAVSLIEEMDDMSPAKALRLLNRSVYYTSKGEVNMTFLVMSLDIKTGLLTYANASQEAPFLISQERRTEFLLDSNGLKRSSWRRLLKPLINNNGIPLGRYPDMEYKETSVQLKPGDTMILYTDGVMDQMNYEKMTWGERAFLRVFTESSIERNEPYFIKSKILEESRAFRDDLALFDDVTFVIFKYKEAEDVEVKKAS